MLWFSLGLVQVKIRFMLVLCQVHVSLLTMVANAFTKNKINGLVTVIELDQVSLLTMVTKTFAKNKINRLVTVIELDQVSLLTMVTKTFAKNKINRLVTVMLHNGGQSNYKK